MGGGEEKGELYIHVSKRGRNFTTLTCSLMAVMTSSADRETVFLVPFFIITGNFPDVSERGERVYTLRMSCYVIMCVSHDGDFQGRQAV